MTIANRGKQVSVFQATVKRSTCDAHSMRATKPPAHRVVAVACIEDLETEVSQHPIMSWSEAMRDGVEAISRGTSTATLNETNSGEVN